MHQDAVDLPRQEVTMCQQNLLLYYKSKSQREQTDQKHLTAYCRVVFILPFETVVVESYFSIMNYNKSKARSSLKDESVANVLHTREAHSVLENPRSPFQNSLKLRLDAHLEHRLNF